MNYFDICDLLRENLALHANIEFELEAVLSVQVVSQLNSRLLHQRVTGGFGLYHAELYMKPGSATITMI